MGHPIAIDVSGHMAFNGNNLSRMREDQIVRAGIGRKFQKPTVFEALSVFENLELAMAADKRILPTLTARMTGEIRDRISMETVLKAANTGHASAPTTPTTSQCCLNVTATRTR